MAPTRARFMPRTTRQTAPNSESSRLNSGVASPIVCRAVRAERDTVLSKIVADRDLAAERVATPLNVELIQIVRTRLHEDRNVQGRKSQDVGDGFLVAEVWQTDKHAVDPVTVLAKQFGTRLRMLPRLHRAELGLVFAEHDRLDFERREQRHEIAPCLRNKLIGEKIAIAKDHCQSMRCHDPIRSVLIRVLPWRYFRAKMPN
jgi:hypothetical protein